MKSASVLVWATDVGLGPPPWTTTAVYLWLAMLCVWAWRGRRATGGRLDSFLWLGLAAMFAALAVARPFGLQWRLAGAFRHRAVDDDWYDARRWFQAKVILAVAALSVLGMIGTAVVAVRRRSSRTFLAFAPVAALLGFLVVRAVSLHYVDRVLYRKVAGVEVNAMAELTLLGLVAAGLTWRVLGARQDPGGRGRA